MTRRLFTVWYPLVLPVAWWMLHLLVEASLVQYTCTAPRLLWTEHLATAIAGVGAALGVALAWPRRSEFLGMLGIIVSATNVLLILAEGSLVVGLGSHRCG